MLDAKSLSEAIRVKRKKLKADGVENMIDTDPHPQMNPQDIMNLKQRAQMEETMHLPQKSEAPSDPANASLSDPDGSTQEISELKKKMERVRKILGMLSVG
jgi:hypothetical protein